METDLARVPLNVALYAVPVQPVRVVTIDGQRNLQILRLADSPDGSRASAVQMVQYRLHEGALERQSTPAQRFYGAAPAGQLETVAIAPGIVDLQVRVWRNGVGWITPASDADTAGTPGVEVQLQRSDGSVLRRVFMVG
jgi:type II secretory pathway component PulJ